LSVEVEIIPLLHNTSSIQRMLDFARLVVSLRLKRLVLTKVYGAAAQHGLGDLGRILYKSGVSLLILSDLSDAVELLKPDITFIVTKSNNPSSFDPLNPPTVRGRVLVAFNGGEPDFTPEESSLGKPIYPRGTEGRMGPNAEASLVLYSLTRSVGGGEKTSREAGV